VTVRNLTNPSRNLLIHKGGGRLGYSTIPKGVREHTFVFSSEDEFLGCGHLQSLLREGLVSVIHPDPTREISPKGVRKLRIPPDDVLCAD